MLLSIIDSKTKKTGQDIEDLNNTPTKLDLMDVN